MCVCMKLARRSTDLEERQLLYRIKKKKKKKVSREANLEKTSKIQSGVQIGQFRALTNTWSILNRTELKQNWKHNC